MADDYVYDVIIIGEGMAGVAAGYTLSENDPSGMMRVNVIEARDRRGGRIYQEEDLALGVNHIHGACHSNPIYLMMRKKGITHKKMFGYIDGHFFSSHQNRVFRAEECRKAVEIFEKIKAESGVAHPRRDWGKQSLRDFYEKRVEEELQKIKVIDAATPGSPYAALDIEDLSMILNSLVQKFQDRVGDTVDDVHLKLYGSGRARELPGGDVVTDDMIDVIMALDTQEYERESEVTEIKWSDDIVELKINKLITGEEKVYKSKHVIFTIPLGVLQAKRDLFLPPLNEGKVNAIKNMRPGRVAKVLFRLSRGEDLNFGTINFTWTKEELEMSKEGDGWMTGVSCIKQICQVESRYEMLVVGEAASVVDKLSDDDLYDGINKLLRRFGGNHEMLYVTHFMRYPWTTDPYTLGYMSHPSTDSNPEDYTELLTPLPSPENPRLLLAGEHTHPIHWGTLLGAYLSGEKQAEKVLNFMKSTRKVNEE